MKRRIASSEVDPDHTPGARLIAAFVAVLFFAPLLLITWWLCNLELAWFTDQWLPGKVVLGAIVASALLGFMLPRVAPTVFGWLARGFYWLARPGRW